MAVQEHPRYEEWSKALDRLKEANDRFRDAKQRNDPGLEAYELDLDKAQKAYDEIADELE